MNFFSGYFRTSRAIPGEIPGQAYGNFPSPLRKVLQSFPERTPVLPEKNWSTPRRGLETDTELLPQPSVYTLSQIGKYSSTPRKKLEYSPKRTGNGYGIATATIRIYAPVSLDCHNRYPDLPIMPILDDP